jgi:hypothetical protein
MHSRGFEEAHAAHLFADTSSLVGQVRRFGEAGPAYQVIGMEEPDKVFVEVIYSGERVTCAVADVLDDPMAETIP